MDGIRDLIPVFYALLNNAVLLFGLGFMYAATNYDQNQSRYRRKVILGIVVGLITVLIMLNPWTFEEGVFFDTRSVIIAVTGLFFGPLTTGVAIVIPLIYRLYLGGRGIYSSVLTILVSAGFGLSWSRIKHFLPKKSGFIEYYFFGLILHVLVMMCFLTIPCISSS